MFVTMDQKPHNGCEIQNLADGECGAMLSMKVVKSPEEEAKLAKENPKPWHNWDITPGGKILFDLIKPWLNADCVLVANLAFASVKVAEKLEENKTGFIRAIEQATTGFPMQHLLTVEMSGKRGGKTNIAFEYDFVFPIICAHITQQSQSHALCCT